MRFGQEGLDLDVCSSQGMPRTVPSYTGLRQSAFWRCLRLQKAQLLLLNSYKGEREYLLNIVSYLDVTGFVFVGFFFYLPRWGVRSVGGYVLRNL